MEISYAKLANHVCKTGRYAKHAYLYRVGYAEDMDYLVVNQHYIIPVKKGLDYASDVQEFKGAEDWIEEVANKFHDDLEYVGIKEYIPGKYVCVFKAEGEEETIWINRSFFTEFINKAFSPTGGFAKGITFTGSDSEHPIIMWNGDDFAGLFLPISH